MKQTLIRRLALALILALPAVAFAQSFPGPLYTYTEPGGLITKGMFSALAEEVEQIEAALGIDFGGIDNHAFDDPSTTGKATLGTGITTGSPAKAALQLPIFTAEPPTVNGTVWIREDGSLRFRIAGDTIELREAAGITAIEEDGTPLSPFSSTLNFTGAGITCGPSGGDIVCNVPGGGSSIVLDLGDNGVNESTALGELAVTGDTNGIFSESAADKLLIAVGNDWPKADTADDLTCTNCIGGTEIDETGLVLDDDQVAFDDANSDWTATTVGAALEELVASINAGVPNSGTAKVHWSQLAGVPAGFVDGTDDGGGGSAVAVDIDDDGDDTAALERIVVLNDSGGAFVVAADELTIDVANFPAGGGSGDSISVNGSGATDANFVAGSEITWSLNTGATPDEITAAIAASVTRDSEWDTAAEINAATTDDDLATLTGSQTLTNKTIDGDLNTILDVDDDEVNFDDADSNFTAATVAAALEELDDVINAGAPNDATAKVDWSQLGNVPAGFADGSDDGGGGGSPGGNADDIQVNDGSSGFAGESAFEYSRTNNRLSLTGGTVATDGSDSAFDFAATLPASPSAAVEGLEYQITSAGSASQAQRGSYTNLAAGYTGSSRTAAIEAENAAAGTGTSLNTAANGFALNSAMSGLTNGSTAGTNVGATGEARSSTGVNVGTVGKSASSVAGSNIGVLGSAANSSEATDFRNIGVLGTLASSFATENVNAAGYFDGGTLADATSYIVRSRGTLPSSPAAETIGLFHAITSAGSASQNQIGATYLLSAGYTGSSRTTALTASNVAVGTGATLNLGATGNPTGNVGLSSVAAGVGAGMTFGVFGEARGSSSSGVGVLGKSSAAVAGSNIGVLGNATNSSEATDLKNIGVLGTLAATLPTENVSAGGYFDGGTLADAASYIARFRGTLPSSPAAAANGILVSVTSAGSASQVQRGMDVGLAAGYTGSSNTVGMAVSNAAAGTGNTLGLGTDGGLTGNKSIGVTTSGAGGGINVGVEGIGTGSTGTNIGLQGEAAGSAAGSNIGVLATAANSSEGTGLVNVGLLGTTDTALPAANVSAGVLAAAAAAGFPLRAYYDDTEVLRVDDSATAADTFLFIYDVDNGALQRVSVDADDSCGLGFKCLRIAN